MNAKIQKIELFVLFTLSLISVLAFSFGGQFGDNVFQITSESNSVGFFSYYLSSFVIYVEFFTGLWVLFAFFIFTLFYAFLFSKRDHIIDSIVVLPLMGVCLFTSYIFAPSMVGGGLGLILRQEVGIFLALLFDFLCLVAYLAGSFRASFKDRVIQSAKTVGQMPQGLLEWKQKVTHKDPTDKYRAAKKSTFSISKLVQLKLPSVLKGSNTAAKQLPPAKEKKSFADLLRAKKGSSTGLPQTEPAPIKPTDDQVPMFEESETQRSAVSIEDIEDETPVQVAAEEQAQVQGRDDSSDDSDQDQNYNEGPVLTKMETGVGENHDRKMLQIQRKQSNDKKVDPREYGKIVSCLKENRTPTINNVPNEYFGEIIQILETKLSEFDIAGKIVNIMKGPVVDTFELELGPGIKVSKVSNRSDDLSLALKGVPVRIVYPMEGKTTVGIEVPRDPREIIYLDQIINGSIFERNNAALPIAMGKDAFGDVMIEDLAKMPHMLVAGATGSGKSVFINTLLISLLVKKSPSELKLILIDPKQLELALYHELPHLALPVITEPKIAAVSLLWAVQEMERRYSIMAEFGVRSIDGFNDKLESATPDMIARIHQHYEGTSDDEGYRLPYVVIIIDEFADLMLTKSGKEIEIYVNRLAAKARAAGIHLVVATQRPSVKVITGNIKSNFPSRVSFKVISGIDSRTILDSQGAEKLLGMGDMLFTRGVSSKRAHSAFISDAQVGELVQNLSKIACSFLPTAMAFLENGGEEDGPGEVTVTIGGSKGKLDDRYDEALEVARQKGVVSASMLQRTMGIGYPKAAKIVDQMEQNGIIGPARGSKPRELLI